MKDNHVGNGSDDKMAMIPKVTATYVREEGIISSLPRQGVA